MILLIDDNPAVAQALDIAFRMAGHHLAVATGPEEAFSLLARRNFDAIVLDLNFTAGKADGREGLACLERIMADDAAACVVVLTAHGGIRTAVAAMQAGASDFAVKPWSNADLIAKVEAAIGRGRTPPSAPSHGRDDPDAPAPRLLGDSPPIAALRDLIGRIGPTSAGVAIAGPAGSGRMLAALTIHAASAHSDEEPLRLDMRDGAAWARIEGARGTVVLRRPDRLDDLAQDRLDELLPQHVRLIAIVEDIAALTPALRRRVATVDIAVPPLAERGDDVLLLARHFLRAAADRFGRPVPILTDGAAAAIRAAPWPDQVRGLALAMERAVLLGEGGTVDAAALTLSAAPAQGSAATGPETPRNFDLTDHERTMIEAALREHRHNVSHAARALGLSRGALYRRMERYGL